MRIDPATRLNPAQRPMSSRGDGTSGFAAILNAQREREPDTSATTATRPDFTQMSRSDLFNWMNGEIRGGRMSLDDSSAFLGMTIRIPVDGGPTGSLDTDPADFVALAQDGIAGARARHDAAGIATLQTALDIMRGDAARR